MMPLSLSIADAAKAIGIGRTKIYSLIASGELRSIKIGRRTVIPVTSIRKLLGDPELQLPPDSAS